MGVALKYKTSNCILLPTLWGDVYNVLGVLFRSDWRQYLNKLCQCNIHFCWNHLHLGFSIYGDRKSCSPQSLSDIAVIYHVTKCLIMSRTSQKGQVSQWLAASYRISIDNMNGGRRTLKDSISYRGLIIIESKGLIYYWEGCFLIYLYIYVPYSSILEG